MQHIWPEVHWRKARRHSDTRLGSASNTPQVEHISGRGKEFKRHVVGGPEFQDVTGADVLDFPMRNAELVKDRYGSVEVGAGGNDKAQMIQTSPVLIMAVAEGCFSPFALQSDVEYVSGVSPSCRTRGTMPAAELGA